MRLHVSELSRSSAVLFCALALSLFNRFESAFADGGVRGGAFAAANVTRRGSVDSTPVLGMLADGSEIVTGVVSTLMRDDFAARSHSMTAVLMEDSGRITAMADVGAHEVLSTQRVRWRIRRMAALSAEPIRAVPSTWSTAIRVAVLDAPPASAPAPPPRLLQATVEVDFKDKNRILVVRVGIANADGVMQWPAYCDETCVANNMWRGRRNVAAAMVDSSSGFTFYSDTEPDERKRSRVVSVAIPGVMTAGSCDFVEWGEAALSKVPDASGFVFKMILLPRQNSCPWAGAAFVGCSTSLCHSYIRNPDGLVFLHELGHNLGMFHASTDTNDDGRVDSGAEYGDVTCPMGLASSWRRFNALHRYQVDWIPFEAISNVPGSSAPVTLYSSSISPPSRVSTQLLRVNRKSTSYFVTLRTTPPDGSSSLDGDMPGTLRDRVYIHRWTGSNTLLVKSLGVGESYDASVGGVKITLLSLSRAGDVHSASVRVVAEPAPVTTASRTSTSGVVVATATATVTQSPVVATSSCAPTRSSSRSVTLSRTRTATRTRSIGSSATRTASRTRTPSRSRTWSLSPTQSRAASSTRTALPSLSPSNSVTPTVTPTVSAPRCVRRAAVATLASRVAFERRPSCADDAVMQIPRVTVRNPSDACAEPSSVTLFSDFTLPTGWQLQFCFPLSVTIVLDDGSDALQWFLRRTRDNTLIATGEHESKTVTYCTLPDDEIEFIIYDSGSNGLCCANGVGSYTVKMGDTVVATGGSFAFVDLVTFRYPSTAWTFPLAGGASQSLSSAIAIRGGTISTSVVLPFVAVDEIGSSVVGVDATYRCG